MSRYYTKKNKKRSDFKNHIIVRQIDKIDSLQKIVSELKIDCEEKDKIIQSINTIRDDLFETVDELKNKSNEYDRLIAELTEMRNVMNKMVFKGRWKLARLLLK